MDFSGFYNFLAINHLSHWLETLSIILSTWRGQFKHKNFKVWENAVQTLPLLIPESLDLVDGVSADSTLITCRHRVGIENLLRQLMPWRKGPFSLYGVYIDSEWRSDWKWDRLFPYISSLSGRIVLDVGCGSGYHMWRMLGAGARLVVGIDPIPLFLCQFEAVRKLLGGDQRVHLLPISIENLPVMKVFDTVFSMGVLYHRRSPLDHLIQLKNQLVDGGELVLETLVVEGDDQRVLTPKERYVHMNNVYFIPSSGALKRWVERCGFKDVEIVNTSVLSVYEQRYTNWAHNHSLSSFLDPENSDRTIEGYPSPRRVILIAKKNIKHISL
ncbi:tRNA 5-methoxyuridine(34)/uridine 5-oxyacetic acid(34) synthase CmoB [Candidatus Erwinia haradaeae]|uniref:tRNA U34 carboxymethyltransferase n=1 Tax=Candidatus Erwinia haradaeae TaxID=1922217 RepID=A0A451D8K0_9GAMM|nr:tRNA 5-methoxyuridine(34)/uridine 5-oxyacetic acid(34) synthase CmoB [Candidatus Erwinia haradaeae]VFP82126.1 tRNA U34 carboxymethyltransferase [Candidatus Erwinia haradaeae]